MITKKVRNYRSVTSGGGEMGRQRVKYEFESGIELSLMSYNYISSFIKPRKSLITIKS